MSSNFFVKKEVDVKKKTDQKKPVYTIDDYMPEVGTIPRERSEKYPFGKLEIGKSFFVQTDGDKKKQSVLSSTVCGANIRYSIIDPEGATRVNNRGNTVPVRVQLRKFIIIPVEEKGVIGARVCRVRVDV